MTNYEKYKDEIIELLAKGYIVAVNKKNEITACRNCEDCLFDGNCHDRKVAWFNDEYVEPPVDWTKVDVDTPVLVSKDNKNWFKRYFAKYANGKVWTWALGKTSWTDDGENDTMPWEYAKLAEKE